MEKVDTKNLGIFSPWESYDYCRNKQQNKFVFENKGSHFPHESLYVGNFMIIFELFVFIIFLCLN